MRTISVYELTAEWDADNSAESADQCPMEPPTLRHTLKFVCTERRYFHDRKWFCQVWKSIMASWLRTEKGEKNRLNSALFEAKFRGTTKGGKSARGSHCHRQINISAENNSPNVWCASGWGDTSEKQSQLHVNIAGKQNQTQYIASLKEERKNGKKVLIRNLAPLGIATEEVTYHWQHKKMAK